jgi:hypothetical protein
VERPCGNIKDGSIGVMGVAIGESESETSPFGVANCRDVRDSVVRLGRIEERQR